MSKQTAFGDFGDGPPESITVFLVTLRNPLATERLKDSPDFRLSIDVEATSEAEAMILATESCPGWTVLNAKHKTYGNLHVHRFPDGSVKRI